ncbi:MAG TPA: hypothetical protein VNT79_00370 [Phycisphaerae bacterium]|nr:hypothetical protein [Phycisphaerae bacterium]
MKTIFSAVFLVGCMSGQLIAQISPEIDESRVSELRERVLTLDALVTELDVMMLGRKSQYEALQSKRPEDLPITGDVQAMLTNDPAQLELEQRAAQAQGMLDEASTLYGPDHPLARESLAQRDAAAQAFRQDQASKILHYQSQQIEQARRSYLEAQDQQLALREKLMLTKAEQRDLEVRLASYEAQPPEEQPQPRRRQLNQDKNRVQPPPDAMSEIKQLEERAKGMSWGDEAPLIHQAHVNVFQSHGWNSESDQFALNLIQQVTNIAPWEPKRREDVFLTGVQTRLNLSDEQRKLVADEMRQESMQLAMKHFRTMFPVVMEVAKTRLDKKPFTPEQVQKWSQHLRPVMDDALAALQRSTKKLESTLSDSQKAKLNQDMTALLRRHNDVQKMVDRWQAGQWNPTEWGLDHDPIHAVAVANYRATEAKRNQLVLNAESAQTAAPAIRTDDESEWRKYVRWFVTYYKCDERQTSQAESILKNCEKEAADYLRSRDKELKKGEEMAAAEQDAAKKAFLQGEVSRLRKPISEIFERLKKRLESQVLTSEQRKLIPKAPQAAAKSAQAAAKP